MITFGFGGRNRDDNFDKEKANTMIRRTKKNKNITVIMRKERDA